MGLSMTWVSLSIDAFQDWKLVSSFYQEDAARYMMVAVIIASLLLSLSIGSLLIGQMISLGENLTTLETFVPNITLNVENGLCSCRSIRGVGSKILLRFSGINIGFCLMRHIMRRVFDICVMDDENVLIFIPKTDIQQ